MEINKKQYWIFRIAALLLCLTLISTYLLGGLYAKYITSATGEDSARVAKFDVAHMEEGTGFNTLFPLEIKPGTNAIYCFQAKNSGEVLTEVAAELKIEGNLPIAVEYSTDNTNWSEWDTEQSWCNVLPMDGKYYDYYVRLSFNDNRYENAGTVAAVIFTLTIRQVD